MEQILNNFPGGEKTIMHFENDDFGIYECHAFITFGQGNHMDLLYSQINIKEIMIRDKIIYPYPGSVFEIYFPIIHLSPKDLPYNSSSYLINDQPLYSIDQGLTKGCSYASILFFSYPCETRHLNFTNIQGKNEYRPKIWLCYNSAVAGKHRLEVQYVSIEFTVVPQTFIMGDLEITREKFSGVLKQNLIKLGEIVFLLKDCIELILVIGISDLCLSCLRSEMDCIASNICDTICITFQALQYNLVGKGGSDNCLVLNHENDNGVVASELVERMEQWTTVCFAERDLAHESNQPLFSIIVQRVT